MLSNKMDFSSCAIWTGFHKSSYILTCMVLCHVVYNYYNHNNLTAPVATNSVSDQKTLYQCCMYLAVEPVSNMDTDAS